METEFHYLTKTVIELHNDVKFIKKRIKEQDAYLEDLQLKYRLSKMTTARFGSLAFSAGLVRDELVERLEIVTAARKAGLDKLAIPALLTDWVVN